MSNLYTQIDMLRQERDEARADRNLLAQKVADLTSILERERDRARRQQTEWDYEAWLAVVNGPPIANPTTSGLAALAARDARVAAEARESVLAELRQKGVLK